VDIEPEAFRIQRSMMDSNNGLLPPDTFPVADTLADRVDRAAAGKADMVAAEAGMVVGIADLSIREIGLCQAILPGLAVSVILGLPT